MGRRLAYIDWLRGIAVLLMIQVHAYNAWLAPEARPSRTWELSRTLGGYAAPLFLFLAGVALALLLEGRRARGDDSRAVVVEGLRRGAEVFGYALAFRLWMLTTGGFRAPQTLLRVDVLNCIGLSMMMVAAALAFRDRGVRALACVAMAAALAALAPPAWDAAWPPWIPTALLGYVNGRVPGSFFPLLPWGGFTAAGAAVGIALTAAREHGRERQALFAMGGAGALVAFAAPRLHDLAPPVYAVSDFWHTGPAFFAMRAGILLALMAIANLWDRGLRWSPIRQLGRTSLLVYWVHVEIVYGAIVAGGLRGHLGVREASLALVALCLTMLVLSVLRTRHTDRARSTGMLAARTA